jgi:hypothetical protein
MRLRLLGQHERTGRLTIAWCGPRVGRGMKKLSLPAGSWKSAPQFVSPGWGLLREEIRQRKYQDCPEGDPGKYNEGSAASMAPSVPSSRDPFAPSVNLDFRHTDSARSALWTAASMNGTYPTTFEISNLRASKKNRRFVATLRLKYVKMSK